MPELVYNPLEKAPPKHLSPIIHELAERGIGGEWGKSLIDLDLKLDPKYEDESPMTQYAQCIKLLAEEAPIRIIPNELIIGAATLKDVTKHMVPVKSPRFKSVSHTTIALDKGLKIGYDGLRKEIEDRLARNDLDQDGLDLLNAMKGCLDAANIWKNRYMEKLDDLITKSSGKIKEIYQKVYKNIINVPNKPAKNFYESVQSLWFMLCFLQLCGNWIAVGRIDEMLGSYLENDLKNKILTLDEARDILAHFWIKGTQLACTDNTEVFSTPGGGDGQYYQNIILAGINSNNEEVLNSVSYLVLDIVEELHISDFTISIRVNENTPDEFLKRIAEVQRLGGGIVCIYNESQIIQSLIDFGYPIEDARSFTNDGCWEIIIPRKTNFIYWPLDSLYMLQLVLRKKSTSNVNSFEELFQLFKEKLRKEINKYNKLVDRYGTSNHPAALISLFVEDCIERARGFFNKGPRYTIFGSHLGGIPDTGNCLYIIKKLVFEEKKVKLPHLLSAINNNWENEEELRRYIKKSYQLYGNDNPEVDAIVKRVFDIYIDIASETPERNGVLRPPGVSTFGRQVIWIDSRGATAMGTFKGDYLSSNFSPTPGTDLQGPTAVIKSHCSMGLKRLINGTSLILKIHPSSIKGEKGLMTFAALMKSFIKLGGIHLSIDIVDSEMLKNAQKHPEKYPNLSVRIAGWSARFTTLNKEFQDMIIQRTEQKV